jgi:hypothetical protein
MGLLLLLSGVGMFFVTYTKAAPEEFHWLLHVLGVLGFLECALMFWGSWYLATHKPRLILRRERLQYWEGRNLRWDASYGDILEVGMFSPVHPLFGYRVPWISCLGFRLADLPGFDKAYPKLARRWRRFRKRNGFDLGIPLVYLYEPKERYVEAVLRCYHRFQRGQRETKSSGSQGS